MGGGDCGNSKCRRMPRVISFSDDWESGAIACPETRDFAKTPHQPCSKEAVRQAAMAGNALAIHPGSFDYDMSQ